MNNKIKKILAIVLVLVMALGSVAALDAPAPDPAATGTNPAATGTDPAVPGTDPAAPGTNPTVPGTDPAVPGTNPTVPGTNPTVPGTNPTVPGTDPAVPGTDPTVPGTDSVAPVVPQWQILYGLKGTDTFAAKLGVLLPGVSVSEEKLAELQQAADENAFYTAFRAFVKELLPNQDEAAVEALLEISDDKAFAARFTELLTATPAEKPGTPGNEPETDLKNVSDEELYAGLMNSTSPADINKLVEAYGGTEKYKAFLEGLEADKKDALLAHLNEVFVSEPYVPHTVVFTQAGPFMPAVPVQTMLRMARTYKMSKTAADPNDADGNGLALKKTAVPNGDGYTITLESWTTGKVTTNEKVTPADICIVVDQSESMLESLGGTKKSEALKKALHNFIGNVQGKQGNGSNHRIAIEGYADNQNYNKRYLHTGWVTVDQTGADKLNKAVDGMEFVGRNTDIRHGMDGANTLMNGKYNPPAGADKRQKVVIVFTDGYPSTLESYGVQDDFDINISNAAVVTANDLKKAGVTIYTVGMFEGANPQELFGTTTDGMGTTCSGKMYESWAHKEKLQSYNPASNRLLNYVSSNVPHHVINTGKDTYDISLGLDYSYTAVGMDNMHRFEIRSILHKTQDGYYLTAADEATLDNVFQTIVENVATPTIELGKEAVLRDTVTEHFNMPKNTSDIKVYTASANADGTFNKRQPDKTPKPTVKGNTVEVTGFDYNANFLTKKPHADGSYGKKLIVEFTVTPKNDFLGGNQVPTNAENSGVYKSSKDNTLIEKFAVPEVDVPILPVTVKAADKNVYLNGSLTEADLKTGAVAEVTYRDGKTKKAVTELTPEQKKFVKEPVFSVSPAGINNISADSTYTCSVEISPKNPGSVKESTGSGTGKINVFEPVFTAKDSNIYLGNKPDYAENITGIQWKHGDVNAETVEMIGTAPQLSFEFTPAADAFKEDTKVTAGAKVGTLEAKHKATFSVNVFKPEMSFKDSEIFLGETPDYKQNRVGSTVWKHETTKSTDSGVVMSGTAPELELVYSPAASMFEKNTDVKVTVNAVTGTATAFSKEDITQYTVINNTGDSGLQSDPKINHAFTVFVKGGSLKITKTGAAPGEGFLFHVISDKGANFDVFVSNGETVEIKGLGAGKYTVTEDAAWAWKYAVPAAQTSELTGTHNVLEFTFNNSLDSETKPLNGDCSVVNKAGIA